MEKDFQIIPHTADLQLHVEGRTLQDLFRNALVGMFRSIKPEAPECEYKNNVLVCSVLSCKRSVDVKSYDKESLLVDFLSEALYFSDLLDEAYLDVKISKFDDYQIVAELYGVKVKGFENEIKAVTYHDLHIEQKDDKWQVDIVFDI